MYTDSLTVAPMVSLVQRFHCTGQLTVVPMVSLVQRFHCKLHSTGVMYLCFLMTFIVTLLFSVALSLLFVRSYSCFAVVEYSHGNCTIWCMCSAPLHKQYAQSMITVCVGACT